jgi:hypothetical protein
VKDRHSLEPNPEVLSEPVRTRLLERATELDSAYRASGTVAELRAAAIEAGISGPAFDAALAELRDAEQSRVSDARTQNKRRGRVRTLAAAIIGVIALGSIGLARNPTPTSASTLMVEESIVLRCLSSGQAAELARPYLGLPTNTVAYSPERRPGMLTIHATRDQIDNVRSNRNDGAGSPACQR